MKPVALITGATGTIGGALARRMAGDYRLSLVYRSPEKRKRLEDFQKEGALLIQGDLRHPDEAKRIVEETLDHFGRIDVLVNNAGKTDDGLVIRMNEERFRDVIETNLYSVFYMSRAVLRPMIKQKSGRIVNIASVVGVTGNAGQANYAASKAGVIAFTKSLAKEVARKNITVNAVCPGFIESEMTEGLEARYLPSIPAARLGRAEDVAEAVAFLASDGAAYVTAKELIVDGGLL